MSKTLISVVSSVNERQLYLESAKWFFRFWTHSFPPLKNVKFRPKVYVIGSGLPPELRKYHQFCELIQTDLPSSFVAQNIRTHAAGLQDSDLVLTTDIDMVPINLRVFSQPLVAVLRDSSCFSVVRDVLPAGQFPICYNVATPQSWRSIYGNSNLQETLTSLKKLYESTSSYGGYSGTRGGAGWYLDQTELFRRLGKADSEGVVRVRRFNDADTRHYRLDREFHNGFLRWKMLKDVLLGRVTDYHLHAGEPHKVFIWLTFLTSVVRWKAQEVFGLFSYAKVAVDLSHRTPQFRRGLGDGL